MPWDRVRLEPPHAARAVVGGLVGVAVVLVLMFVGLYTGVLRFNIMDVVASVSAFGEVVPTNSANYVYGIIFFALWTIVVVPLCYAYWGYSYLPGAPWMRGLLAGVAVWFLMQMLMMPLSGHGVFDFRGPYTAVEIIGQFILWAIYGIVLGVIAGPQEVWQQRWRQEQRA